MRLMKVIGMGFACSFGSVAAAHEMIAGTEREVCLESGLCTTMALWRLERDGHWVWDHYQEVTEDVSLVSTGVAFTGVLMGFDDLEDFTNIEPTEEVPLLLADERLEAFLRALADGDLVAGAAPIEPALSADIAEYLDRLTAVEAAIAALEGSEEDRAAALAAIRERLARLEGQVSVENLKILVSDVLRELNFATEEELTELRTSLEDRIADQEAANREQAGAIGNLTARVEALERRPVPEAPPVPAEDTLSPAERAEIEQLIPAQTEGQFSILQFLRDHWWKFLLGAVLLVLLFALAAYLSRRTRKTRQIKEDERRAAEVAALRADIPRPEEVKRAAEEGALAAVQPIADRLTAVESRLVVVADTANRALNRVVEEFSAVINKDGSFSENNLPSSDFIRGLRDSDSFVVLLSPVDHPHTVYQVRFTVREKALLHDQPGLMVAGVRDKRNAIQFSLEAVKRTLRDAIRSGKLSERVDNITEFSRRQAGG